MHRIVMVVVSGIFMFMPFLPATAQMTTVDEFTRALSPSAADDASDTKHRIVNTRGMDAVKAGPAALSKDMNLNFENNSAELTDEALQLLDNLGKALESDALKKYVYRLEGHTCDLGRKEYNQQLSRDRVLAVRHYLTGEFHFDWDQFKVEWYGESRPAIPNVNEEARKKNRRVVIVNTLERTKLADQPGIDERFEFNVKYVTEFGEQTLRSGGSMKSGQKYTIHFRPSEDLSIYIYQLDTAGKETMLFPNSDFTEMTNPVYEDTYIRLPKSGYWFFLDEATGEERIVLIASKMTLDDPLAAYRKMYNQERGSDEALVAAVIRPGANPRGLSFTVHEQPPLFTKKVIKTEGLAASRSGTVGNQGSDPDLFVMEYDFNHM